MRMKNDEKAMLGFSSPLDFLNTLLGFKHWVINTWLAFICAFTSFVSNYVWDSPDAVYTLIALMLLDCLTGVILAIRAFYYLKFKSERLTDNEVEKYKKRAFRSTRLPRMFVAIPLSMLMLSVAWWLSKANVIYYFLPGMVYGGLTGTYLISLIENAAEYGLFSQDIVNALKDKLNPLNWIK